MSTVTASRQTSAPAFQGHDAADYPGHDHPTTAAAWPSRISVLLEALAYAGAAVDPVAALAARRFARVRDEERQGRR